MQGSFNKSFQLGGFAFANSAVAPVSFDASVVVELTLPAGKVVTNWVKTDDNTAACDLPAGHGQTNGKFDVYWTISGVNYARYGVDGTITTNALALDGGAGDNFPASSTTGIVCTKQVVSAATIDGDNVKLFGVFLSSTDAAAPGSCDLQDASNNSIEQFDLIEVRAAAGMNHAYSTAQAVALLTGNVITQIKASNGSSTASATLYVLAGIDSTP